MSCTGQSEAKDAMPDREFSARMLKPARYGNRNHLEEFIQETPCCTVLILYLPCCTVLIHPTP
jgi:hypothetical protein